MKNNIESDFPPFGNPKSESALAQLGITGNLRQRPVANRCAHLHFSQGVLKAKLAYCGYALLWGQVLLNARSPMSDYDLADHY